MGEDFRAAALHRGAQSRANTPLHQKESAEVVWASD